MTQKINFKINPENNVIVISKKDFAHLNNNMQALLRICFEFKPDKELGGVPLFSKYLYSIGKISDLASIEYSTGKGVFGMLHKCTKKDDGLVVLVRDVTYEDMLRLGYIFSNGKDVARWSTLKQPPKIQIK